VYIALNLNQIIEPEQKMTQRLLTAALTALTAFMLFSCGPASTALNEDAVKGGLYLPENFTEASGGADYGSEWWKVFGSEELNSLMNKMFEQNYRLAQSYEGLRAMKTFIGISSADRMPSVSANANAGETYSTNSKGERKWNDSYGISLSASYEADVWGRASAGAESDRQALVSGIYDLQSLYMTLSAELAERYFIYKSLANIYRLQQEKLDLRMEQISALERMYTYGVGNLDAVYAAQQSAAGLIADITASRRSMAAAKSQIALLTGESDSTKVEISERYDLNIPPLPAVIPSAVAEKRPDIKAAFADIRQADSDLAEAAANRYPSLSFSASAGYSSDELARIVSPENFIANLAANLVMPLFDAGRRKLQQEQKKYLLEQKVYAYYQTVLEALFEVSYALNENMSKETAHKAALQKLDIEEKRLKVSQMKYRLGVKDYSEVLENKISLLTVWTAQINAKRDLISARIELARASGGDFAADMVGSRLEKTAAVQGEK